MATRNKTTTKGAATAATAATTTTAAAAAAAAAGAAAADYNNLGGYWVDNYKFFPELSAETNAFSAILKLGTRQIAEVSNSGQGGPNEYNFGNESDEKDFLQCARTLYPGIEGEDSFIEELRVRRRMRQVAKQADNKNFPIIVLFRSGVRYFGKDRFYFPHSNTKSYATLAGARAAISKSKPDEFVIYNSIDDTFIAERHQPSEETIARFEQEDANHEQEIERRKNAWSPAEPLANCPRFLVSENEDSRVRITDTETQKTVEMSLYAYNHGGQSILVKLFGTEETK